MSNKCKDARGEEYFDIIQIVWDAQNKHPLRGKNPTTIKPGPL